MNEYIYIYIELAKKIILRISLSSYLLLAADASNHSILDYESPIISIDSVYFARIIYL